MVVMYYFGVNKLGLGRSLAAAYALLLKDLGFIYIGLSFPEFLSK